jgi:hypothetical protein
MLPPVGEAEAGSGGDAGAGVVPAPALIGLDEFQLAIPRRGGTSGSLLWYRDASVRRSAERTS